MFSLFSFLSALRILTPPPQTTFSRFASPFRPGPYSRFWRFRRFVIPTLLRFCFLPFHFFLAFIDELFYSGYRNVPIIKPVLVASTPRTGSTNLTEAIAVNERDFVSPTMGEVLFPYLCFHRFIDLVEATCDRLGFNFRANLHSFLMRLYSVNKETTDRHPFGFFDKGQVEFLCSMWLWVGPGQQFFVPTVEYFDAYAAIGDLDQSILDRFDKAREFVWKKTLYRRGRKPDGGFKRPLMKTHSSDSLGPLYEQYPDATFVFCHRRPSEQVSSIFGLHEAATMSRMKVSVSTPEWVDAQMRWLEKMWIAELENFEEKIPAKSDKSLLKKRRSFKLIPENQKISIQFTSFIRQFESTMKGVYQRIGFENFEDDEYLKRVLAEQTERHLAYKVNRKYANPSLESLGLSGEEIDKKFDIYIKTFLQS